MIPSCKDYEYFLFLPSYQHANVLVKIYNRYHSCSHASVHHINFVISHLRNKNVSRPWTWKSCLKIGETKVNDVQIRSFY